MAPWVIYVWRASWDKLGPCILQCSVSVDLKFYNLETGKEIVEFGSKNLYKPAVLYLAHVPELIDLVNASTQFDL